MTLAFQEAIAGRYSLDREIGRGGMGIVYLALEVHLDRPVAIKLLPPERARDRVLRDRFLREARTAARLSHPNIIPIHAVEDTGEFVFYVMAYVDGETLAERVRVRGPLVGNEGARLLREVAWALAYAHAQGVVHRDVKPDNILIERSSGRVLVTDFGIAAAVGDRDAEVAGTPEFMSPEQALGTTLDARSDIYSLGATAHFALTGRPPFEGKSTTEVLAKQITAPAPRLATGESAIPRALAALVDRCLAKAPDHRPDSAQALAERLGSVIDANREITSVPRAFAKWHGRVGPRLMLSGVVVTATMFLAGTTLLGRWVSPLGVVGLALTGQFIGMVLAARRFLRTGYEHEDLVKAFGAEVLQSRTESAMTRQGPYGIEKVLSRIAAASGVVFLGSVGWGIWIAPEQWDPKWLMFTTIMSAATTIMSIWGRTTLTHRHTDTETETWLWLWKSRLGRAVFAIARRLLRGKTITPGITQRATELSLAIAAEQLYERLPAETREELRDVPEAIGRLREDAESLRASVGSIDKALSEAGDAAAGAEYADVREMLDELRAKFAEAVRALETIRLNLLRLHSGDVSVAGVTTDLDLAAQVSADVERLIQAHGEIERSLNFPRTPDATPV